MSDVAAALPANEFWLRPEEIVIDPRFARPKYGEQSEEREAQRIEKLATSMDAVGQLDTAIVTQFDETPGYVLVGGHRRRRALIRLNEKRTANAQPLLRLRVRIEAGGDLRRKSLAHNVQRNGYSAMELAVLIQELRSEHNWEGVKGTKHIVEYLGLDHATITQHEKFLTAPREVQENLEEGRLSALGAHEMLNVTPGKESEVLERAKKIQAEKDKKLTAKARKKREEAGIEPGQKIEHPAVVQAIRETEGAATEPIALSKKEILASIEQFDSPAYPEPVKAWAKYFTDSFATGSGTYVTMRHKFDAMIGAKKAAVKKTSTAKTKAVTKKTPAKKTEKPSSKPKPEPKSPKKSGKKKASTKKKPPAKAISLDSKTDSQPGPAKKSTKA